jgi:hypothetical protein
VNRALLFVLGCSLKNAVLVRFKRLRQPKYLVGALLGAAYFYFYFYRFLYLGAYHTGSRRIPSHNPTLALTPETTFDLAALGLLFALVLFAWLIPAERSVVALTEAEVAWLLPAPISRSEFIHFKLLKAQIGLLFFALLMTLVTGRLARDGHAIIHTLGWWMVFAIFRLHRLGASFTLTRLKDRGLGTTRRRILVAAGALAFLATLMAWRQSAPSPPDLSAMINAGRFGPYLRELVSSGPAPALLTPFRLVVRPWFARDAVEFIYTVWPALLIGAVHYVWVIRSAVSFEEASVEFAEKRAAWLAARRSGDLRFRSAPRSANAPLFQLRPEGSVITAFVWKAWLQAGGKRTFRIAAGIIAFFLLLALISSVTREWRAAGYIAGLAGFICVCALVFAGPQATAQSVRRELQAADVLRTAPVAGAQVVLGQMLGPSILWAILQWVGLLLMLLGGFAFDEVPHTASQLLAPGALGAALILLPLNVVAALIPTGVMLVFPGWFRPGEMRGLEATGLGLMMVVAQFVFIVASLIAPALAAFGVGYGVQLFAPLWLAVIAASAVAASTLSIEAWAGTLALGKVFERFDPGSEQ